MRLQYYLLRQVALRLIIIVMLTLVLGIMPLWSQNNESKLNDNDNLSQTWSELYNQGLSIYEKQNNISTNLKKEITNLRKEILTIKSGFNELTNLSVELSLSKESLRQYNEQIAQRMQERDEDLVEAYAEINDLKLKYKTEVAKKDKKISEQILHIIILYVILGLIVIGGIVIAIIKGYVKMKMPIRF